MLGHKPHGELLKFGFLDTAMPHLAGRCNCGRKIRLPKHARRGYKWTCWTCGMTWALSDQGKPLHVEGSLPPSEGPSSRSAQPSRCSTRMDPLLKLALGGAVGFVILGYLLGGGIGAVIGLALGIFAMIKVYPMWKDMGGPFG